MEISLNIVKPNAVKKNKVGTIIAAFEDAGLELIALKYLSITKAQAEQFYAVHKGRPFFEELVDFMSSGPIVAMVLKGENAVEVARKTMGATDPAEAEAGTIRALYGDNKGENAVHGSDSVENAAIESAFFFPGLELV